MGRSEEEAEILAKTLLHTKNPPLSFSDGDEYHFAVVASLGHLVERLLHREDLILDIFSLYASLRENSSEGLPWTDYAVAYYTCYAFIPLLTSPVLPARLVQLKDEIKDLCLTFVDPWHKDSVEETKKDLWNLGRWLGQIRIAQEMDGLGQEELMVRGKRILASFSTTPTPSSKEKSLLIPGEVVGATAALVLLSSPNEQEDASFVQEHLLSSLCQEKRQVSRVF